MFSPQSQDILDKLLSGESVKTGSIEIAKLDDAGKRLLSVIVTNQPEFAKSSGADRAKQLRKLYKAQCEQDADETTDSDREPPEITQATADDAVVEDDDARRGYRLQKVTCKSFRGIAPVGVEVEFEFDAKSNLIYGPNGSGKSSLLGAVVWTLTGNTICDADVEKIPHSVAVYKVSASGNTRTKVKEWPVVATLPEGGITDESIPEYSVTVEMVATEGAASLHLRRSIGVDLESSQDGENWEVCPDLAKFGIGPLDLQLSLVAPDVFARCTVESAPDSTKLLSLMLGFDDLDDLGELAGNIARNRTSLANQEKSKNEAGEADLKQCLEQLPELLPSNHEMHADLKSLAARAKPTSDAIKTVGEQINKAVSAAEADLAELVGLDTDDADPPTDLADKLTITLAKLDNGVLPNFSFLSKIKLDKALPESDEMASDEQLQERSERLSQFTSDASTRITERLDWWRKETESSGRATLLLSAAEHYDTEQKECPVCGQSIKDLPISVELTQMKNVDPKLQKSLEDFYRGLINELATIVTPALYNLTEIAPADRIREDWSRLMSSTIPTELASVAAKYSNEIETIAESTIVDEIPPAAVLPEDADEEFKNAGAEFQRQVHVARTAIALLQWSNDNFAAVIDRIDAAILAVNDEDQTSLFNSLSIGKDSATAIKPLIAVRDHLRKAFKQCEELTRLKESHQILEELKALLDGLKQLKKYAESKVARVFGEIKEKTLENWRTLYPKESGGLSPADLTVESRAKIVTAYLAVGTNEVPGQFFANAGLQRAIALSFYFALLDNHPWGLGFAVLDDPILSLDESHRLSWSGGVLRPWMKKAQFVIATHERAYLNECREHFADELVVELIHRPRPGAIRCRPGKRLDRAEEDLDRAPTNAPVEMRKYCEDVLAALDAYSPNSIINDSLRIMRDSYENLPDTHRLAGKAQRKIAARIKDSQVWRIVNECAHGRTEANVTRESVEACLEILRKLQEETVLSEFDGLETLRLHLLWNAEIEVPDTESESRGRPVSFLSLPPDSRWNDRVGIRQLGSAAAKGESWKVDFTGDVSDLFVEPGKAVLVTADVLDPVARAGQWVLLEHEGASVNDGDLVAVTCANNNRLLRRIWCSEDRWTLQSVNPIHPVADVSIANGEAAFRRVVGVLYHPQIPLSLTDSAKIIEWRPRGDFPSDWWADLGAVVVEGTSMDPIARAGQRVLIDKEPAADPSSVKNGELAVVETNVEEIGRVIKRVHHCDGQCILTSPNPVDPHPPLLLTEERVAKSKFWVLRGVLFEISAAE